MPSRLGMRPALLCLTVVATMFMHRFTIVVYLLTLGHVVGSGTDARSPWMIAMLTALTAPIVFGFTYRILPHSQDRKPPVHRRKPRPAPNWLLMGNGRFSTTPSGPSR
jgi:hypothetical protein